MKNEMIEKLLNSRHRLTAELEMGSQGYKGEEEGGCGVVGFCCTEPVSARNIYEPSRQMHNRGNGKGGGVAALGFVPEQLGVTRAMLDEYYLLHIACLDAGVRQELERKYITPYFNIGSSARLETLEDWTSVANLEVKPPDVWRYFVRVKSDVLDSFNTQNNLKGLSRDEAESEFISQNSVRLNQEFYASLGEKKAFVLSYGKDIMILKVVGYAEAITKYYKIDDLRAHVWIAHQRFPTKGRVWHPGGAHPFGAMNTALVHNGDFANYHSVCEYLAQCHIYPQFLTDTEVSVLLFDLLERVYHYPLEYIIESMAPTSELDFERLPEEKRSIYRAIQATHIHGSPDGPWFFIIARSIPREDKLQLMGITDTAMLRPQVFAFYDGEVQVGLIASEKQAIDATLLSLSREDKRICPVADRYWNARGGSHTDGGAFIFDLKRGSRGKFRLTCTDKFNLPVSLPAKTDGFDFSIINYIPKKDIEKEINKCFGNGKASVLFEYIRDNIPLWSFQDIAGAFNLVVELAKDTKNTAVAIEALTLLNDRRYATGSKKRNHIIFMLRGALNRLFRNIPGFDTIPSIESYYRLINYRTRELLRPPTHNETTLFIDTNGFPHEGEDSAATLLLDSYVQGWRHIVCFDCTGQRFIGCGLGPNTQGVTIDVYGSSGDYLGSGIDGLTITVHDNAQDQLGQIIKDGKLVIYGDTGQTFLYGSKGGSIYIMGSAAGRPLINSVGKPRVVINGTCLDFLAESFMAGDVFNGGGFVILNGIKFDDDGNIEGLQEPYPGSNLFSLASGGAIYIRDPREYVVEQQLNDGRFTPLIHKDWELILPYLKENERLFGIKVDELLTVDGQRKPPGEVYRKVIPAAGAALKATDESDE